LRSGIDETHKRQWLRSDPVQALYPIHYQYRDRLMPALQPPPTTRIAPGQPLKTTRLMGVWVVAIPGSPNNSAVYQSVTRAISRHSSSGEGMNWFRTASGIPVPA
jgi:hypothetical protein